MKGLRPFKNNSSPSPSKERGIKGVRLLKILNPNEVAHLLNYV